MSRPSRARRLSPRSLTPPERVAFVLSGGASKGALQVGMLRALVERRIRPDLVVGCSVGALNGALVAADPSLATVGRLQDTWLDLDEAAIFPGASLLPTPVLLARKGESIHSSDGLRALLESVLPVEDFEDLAVPFECVATDLEAATSRWFRSGPLIDAVMASAAIPVVFPPVDVDGRRYIDGAVVDDVPMSRAVELGATKIYVLQVGNFDRPRVEPRRPIDMAMQAFWISRRHRFQRDLAAVPDGVEVTVLPTGETPSIRFNDLTHSAELMDLAYRASADELDRLAGKPVPERATARAGSQTADGGVAGAGGAVGPGAADGGAAGPGAADGIGTGDGDGGTGPSEVSGEGEPPERRPAYIAWMDRLRQRGEPADAP